MRGASAKRAIVAIPAKDEAARLPLCLQALAEQVDFSGRLLPKSAFGVLVLANNCSDGSAEAARLAAVDAPFEIRVVEATLPPEAAHAGGARGLAMDLAEAWLREDSAFDGAILTSDADSRVAPTWVFANLQALAGGADAVLGQISFGEEGNRLPVELQSRGRLEAAYEALLTEMSARLDPQESNPWPHHSTISGASVAVVRDLYLSVGGLPRIPLGEEKALIALLRRHDARIRFAPDVRVVTSGRTDGRAHGGTADTLRLRIGEPAAPCDEALERCVVAFRRALWRGRLRRIGLAYAWRRRKALGLCESDIRRAESASTFGAAWEALEDASPALRRRGLTPAELPLQIAIARRGLRRLIESLATYEHVEPVFGTPLDADNFNAALQAGDEHIRGFVAG